MGYLDRPAPRKGPPWAHNSFGASVHNTLAAWWRLPRPERTVDSARRMLERGWIGDGYADDQQARSHLLRALDMVGRYVAGLDPDREPAGVERTVATRTDLIAISGRIDRLDYRRSGDVGVSSRLGAEADRGGDDQELVVVDYKTGRRSLSADDARSSLALAVYALAAGRVLRRPCRVVELHHLPTGRVLGWKHTPESLERQVRRAEDIAGECSAADRAFTSGRTGDDVFPPSLGAWCGWCDYRAHCPEGQAAAPGHRSFDGLADGEDLTAP